MFLQLYYFPPMDSRLELLLYRWKSLTFCITIPCLTIGLLLYGTVSNTYSSYHNSYVWEVSAIYNIGVVPTVLMFLWLISLLAIVTHFLFMMETQPCAVVVHNSSSNSSESRSSNVSMAIDRDTDCVVGVVSKKSSDYVKDDDGELTPSMMIPVQVHITKNNNVFSRLSITKTDLIEITMILVNVIAVTSVNAAYVSAVKSNITAKELVVVALTIAAFKIGMNYVLRKLGTRIGSRAIIGMTLFNNLISPFIAEVFVSSDCFLYALSEAPALSFSYKVYTCLVLDVPFLSDVPCDFQKVMSTGIGVPSHVSISPPFHYSHQCSFALISSYSYVFIFRYILSGLITPCMIYLFTYIASPTTTQSSHSSAPPHSVDTTPTKSKYRRWWKLWRQATNQLLPTFWRRYDSNDIKSVNKYIKAVEKVVKKSLRIKLGALIVTDLSMLLCFGAMFPPLTIVVCMSIFKDAIDIQMSMNRLFRLEEAIQKHVDRENANDQQGEHGTDMVETTPSSGESLTKENRISHGSNRRSRESNETKKDIKEISWISLYEQVVNVKQRMNQEILAVELDVIKGMRNALLITSVIWACVLFDTSSASSVGMVGSLWVVILLPMSPMFLRKSYPYCWEKCRKSATGDTNKNADMGEMEMTTNVEDKNNTVNPMILT